MNKFWIVGLGALLVACSGNGADGESGNDDSGDSALGDGDSNGNGDGDGDGDSSGDGDGDSSGDGDLGGDGDSSGDGDGDGDSSGDGDGDANGDGDLSGDGDGNPTFCTPVFINGLHVTVVGGMGYGSSGGQGNIIAPPPTGGGTGDPAPDGCLAFVFAVDGDYQEVLSCYPSGADCSCLGAGERPGTYTVTATMGNNTEDQEVTVTADECHVTTESLTFFADR